MKRQIIFLSLLTFALAAFQLQPIPPYEGDDNSQHNGQPKWCQNESDGLFAHNCDCQSTTDNGRCKRGHEEEEGSGPDTYDENSMPRCKVHCRKDACRCRRRCDT